MDIFSLRGKNAVVLGGTGVLGSAIASGLASAGASVAIVGRSERLTEVVDKINKEGNRATGYRADAAQESSLLEVKSRITSDMGPVDILVNAVGGNNPQATAADGKAFFDLSTEALQSVVDINLFGGAILPCKVFGKEMALSGRGGSIINISSMAAYRALTKVVGYAASKAAVSNFTQWLSVSVALSGCTNLRVNAIAPGFFLTEQNRYLLTDKETGDLTERGKKIIDHTPMGRFGDPEDLIGAAVWLAADASKFVTGIVVPVDGGFSAYSGV